MSWQKVLSKAYAAPVKPTIAHELDLSNFDQEFTDVPDLLLSELFPRLFPMFN